MPIEEFRPVVDELVRRLGITEASRRMGAGEDVISERRLRQKDSVRRPTYDKAVEALEAARLAGEDNFDVNAKKIANLTVEGRIKGQKRSAEVRAQRARERRDGTHEREIRRLAREWDRIVKELQRWTDEEKQADKTREVHELSLDALGSDIRWHEDATGDRWPLADFECEHGRLSGDRTPCCGCWPNE